MKYASIFLSDSYGNRTRVTAVKGRCLNRLTKEPFFIRFSEKLLFNLLYLQNHTCKTLYIQLLPFYLGIGPVRLATGHS